jgi:hypothetical protein
MRDKSFWNVNKEKKQIFFLYHFLNLAKGELQKQIDEQLRNPLSDRRGYQANIELHRTHRYPRIELSFDVMQKSVDEATSTIGTLIYRRKLNYLFIPYCDEVYDICLKDYFDTPDEDVDEQAKKILLEIHASKSIPHEAYEWIDLKDDRQINYIWSRLRISFEDKNNQRRLNYAHSLQSKDDISDESFRIQTPLYEELGLEKNASQNDLKLQNVIYFFDLWDTPLGKKQETLETISNNWESIRKDRKMVDWVNKNESYVIHIWDYVISCHSNNEPPKWSYISSIDKKKDVEQTKLALQTFYDLLSNTTNKKTLLTAIKTNVRNKRHYDNHADTTKLINTQVSIEAVNALSELAKIKGKSKKVILENLILEEYSRIKPHEKIDCN